MNRIITTQWEGMGDVGSVRYEPPLLPPCLTMKVTDGRVVRAGVSVT